MSEPKSQSANSKIKRLRNMFIEQLPQRVEQIDVAWLRLQDDINNVVAMTELHRAVHSLKGTGRSFGFRQLGVAADNIEALLNPYLGNSVVALSVDEMAQLNTLLFEFKEDVASIDVAADSGNNQLDLRYVRKNTDGDELPHKLIYFCDDDELASEQLILQLKCFGYQINHFTELEQLSAAMLKQHPDALIMDIGFPEGRHAGTELVGSIRKELKDQLPVVFLSGYDDFDARISAVLAGGNEYFTKPANVQELVDTLDRITNRYPPEPYRILIVDDEPTVAEYHSIVLQEAGMATYCLSEPSSVLDALQEFRADLILMDMYMPKCSGSDLAKLVRQVNQYESMPIIYLSSEADKQKQLSAMRVGAEGFLCKPVNHDELVALVEIQAERMRLLKRFMIRDSMTGLYNHTTTNQLLESAIATVSRRSDFNLCFVMIDIDRFKEVNDTYGHPVGDQVIIALARVLKQRLRGADIVGRYGGEEFVLILQDIDQERAVNIVNELREAFGQLYFNANNDKFSCTFSAGIASFPQYEKLETLREAADKALYRAKNNGRNQIDVA